MLFASIESPSNFVIKTTLIENNSIEFASCLDFENVTNRFTVSRSCLYLVLNSSKNQEVREHRVVLREASKSSKQLYYLLCWRMYFLAFPVSRRRLNSLSHFCGLKKHIQKGFSEKGQHFYETRLSRTLWKINVLKLPYGCFDNIAFSVLATSRIGINCQK